MHTINTNGLLALNDIPLSQESETSNAINEEGFDNIEPTVPTIRMRWRLFIDNMQSEKGLVLEQDRQKK